MGKKLQTIYEYFFEYSFKEINDVIQTLSDVDKELIKCRYGSNLLHPKTALNWNNEKSQKFYGCLLPKIKRLLKKQKKIASKEKTEIEIKEKKEFLVYDKKFDTSLLLDLIKNGLTNSEICKRLNITHERLYEELLKLKNKGFIFDRLFYSDGTLKYKKMFSFKDRKIKNYLNILSKQNCEDSLKVLVISDLHLGNELERLDLINRAYNYCIKNGIHIIFCGGDIVDGAFTKGKQRISDLYDQVEYFIKNYPYDNSILTFSVGGDHDASLVQKLSLDLIEVCNNYRHDIIIGGYNNTEINIKNSKILLHHYISSGYFSKTSSSIILHGHFHHYSSIFKDNVLNINLPTLSNIISLMPSALELNLSFKDDCINSVLIKQIFFGSQDTVLNESIFDFKNVYNKDYINSEAISQKNEQERILRKN